MIKSLSVALLLISLVVAEFPKLEQAVIDLPAAIITHGNISGNSILGVDSELSLFGRQTCPQGYNNCAYTGECCQLNAGPTCCGQFCIGRREAGTNCCDGFLCPPQWKCCGPTCYPEAGQCCTAAGHSCPNADWKCCGNQGRCYPHQDFQCCSDAGEYCPKSTKCVYCRGSTDRICCQGLDNDAEVPVFDTNRPVEDSVADIPQVQPTQAPTQAPEEQASEPTTERQTERTIERTTERFTETQRTTQTQTFQAQATTAYFSTTFYYSYIVWTRITYVESVVQSTITTTSTVLSVLATDSLDAGPTLRSMASSIVERASSRAEAARPTNTNAVTSARQTTTQAAVGGTSGSRSLRADLLVASVMSGITAMVLL